MEALWQNADPELGRKAKKAIKVNPDRASLRAIAVSVLCAILVLALEPRGQGALVAFGILWAGLFAAALLQVFLAPESSAEAKPQEDTLRLKELLNERRRGWGLETLTVDDPCWDELLSPVMASR